MLQFKNNYHRIFKFSHTYNSIFKKSWNVKNNYCKIKCIKCCLIKSLIYSDGSLDVNFFLPSNLNNWFFPTILFTAICNFIVSQFYFISLIKSGCQWLHTFFFFFLLLFLSYIRYKHRDETFFGDILIEIKTFNLIIYLPNNKLKLCPKPFFKCNK